MWNLCYKHGMIVRRIAPAALVCLVVFGAPAGAQAPGEVFWGMARAKDGDSLNVGQREVRLFGIDAPEFDQTCKRSGADWACGAEATEKLSSLATGKEVRCASYGTDQYGRTLAKCSVGQLELNRTMVALGYAVAFTRYSTDYVSAQDSAKLAKRGIWSATFRAPSEFRSDKRSQPSSQPPARARVASPGARSSDWAGRAKANCSIKGNRNRKGQWIYHVPGMPFYDQTRPEEIFCSEAEARTAGYRRAIVR